MIYILGLSYQQARDYAHHTLKLSMKQATYVGEVRRLQGVRFSQGDEVHELSGFRQRGDAQAILAQVGMAEINGVYPAWVVMGDGQTRLPDFSDREAVEAWLDDDLAAFATAGG